MSNFQHIPEIYSDYLPTDEELADAERYSEETLAALGITALNIAEIPESNVIGEGAQQWVIRELDDDPNYVTKFAKSFEEVVATVRSWGLSDDTNPQRIAHQLIRNRSKYIQRMRYDRPLGSLPGDLIGHATFTPYNETAYKCALLIHTIQDDLYIPLDRYGSIRQPLVPQTVGKYLETATSEEASIRYEAFTNLIRRDWWFGVSETTYKFPTQYGELGPEREIWGNPILRLDAGEMTEYGLQVYSHVLTQRWRHVFNSNDAPSLPEQHLKAYYQHMDTALTEDVFHALWGGAYGLRFNTPEAPDSSKFPKRGPELLMNAFDHPAWRAFQIEALGDITKPKAFVMELEQPIDPYEIYLEDPHRYAPRPKYAGLVAYYRQLEPNPLFDGAAEPVNYLPASELPMWYWSLQFIDEQTTKALLNGQDVALENAEGVELQLRQYDSSLYHADFPSITGGELERELKVYISTPTFFSGLSKQQNYYAPRFDEKLLAAFQQNDIKGHRTIEGFPYLGQLQ